MNFAPLVAAFLALSLAGCARPRAKMPIGIFDPPAHVLPDLAAAGFNLITTPASTEILDAAEKADLFVLLRGASRLSDPGTQRLIRQFDRHPAAWGWYLWDEPDLHQVSPRRVQKQNRLFKRFVRKPTVLVLSSGASVEKYRDVADRLALDWYPVPWSSVGTVAREMRLARLGADGRPFLAILQAFDWNIATNLLDTDVPLRAPTPQELRCMTYLALMQGASGVIYYAYTADNWNLSSNSPLHSAVLETAAEIRRNESIFGKRVTWWPAHTEFHGPPHSMFNEIGEARISLALFHARESSAVFYLIAANTTSEPTDFSFKLPFRDVDELATSCPGDQFQGEAGWIRKLYAPFEVCIFGPIKGALADE
jgi:hypothetical protein